MNSRVWSEAYRVIKQEARRMTRRRNAVEYSDALIVAMHYWHVLHDRPQAWACERRNYTSLFRPHRLPSVSWFSRRLRAPRCEELLARVERRWAGPATPQALSFVDGRPLPVGACSKDADARAGRVYGGFARGYKLHALIGENGRVISSKVTSLNVGEQTVARELLIHAHPGSIILGDGNYDATPLYEIAAAQGAQLLAPPRQGAGRGHRKHRPARLAAVARWQAAPAEWARMRRQVERCFSQQSSFGGGLSPLPAWVRTLPRVRRWVNTKLVIYHVRLTLRAQTA